MRNTLSGGNTSSTIWLSSRADCRSCPNGFSMTTRRQPSSAVARPCFLSWDTTTGKSAGRDREVERVVAVGALLLVELAHRVAEPLPGGVVVELARHEPDAGHELLPDRLAPRRARAVLGGLLDERRELLVAEVLPGEADEGESGRQQAAVGQVVDGRDELLAGQVAGDAEQDQAARAGDPGQAAVLRVAQRVRSRCSSEQQLAQRREGDSTRRPGAAAAPGVRARGGPARRRRPGRR